MNWCAMCAAKTPSVSECANSRGTLSPCLPVGPLPRSTPRLLVEMVSRCAQRRRLSFCRLPLSSRLRAVS